MRDWRRTLNRLWQFASLYVPVLLMAVLAAGVYWLVRNTPLPQPAPQERPVRQDPDYFMRGISIQRFNADGTPRTRLWGDEARHYPATETLEIENVRVHAVGKDGQVLVASAHSGVTNKDHTDVRLHGDARVVRLADAVRDADGACVERPRLELRSEFLHILVEAERVVTDQPAQVRRGSSLITADSLEYDHRTQQAVFKGHVRTQIVPDTEGSPVRCDP